MAARVDVNQFRVVRSVVIPMFREARRVERAIEELGDSLFRSPGHEVIFVDDGSDDRTADVAEACLRHQTLDAVVIRLGSNRGKGAAVRAGMLAARGDTIGFLDADLSAGIRDLDQCFKHVEAGHADIVIGSRVHDESRITVHQPFLREFGGKAFNVLIRRLGLTTFCDTQCGLKVFSREAALLLFSSLEIRGFAFDVELLLRARLGGMTILELPIEWAHVEESHVKFFRHSTNMFLDVLNLGLRSRRLRRTTRLLPPDAARGTEAARREPLVLERPWWVDLSDRLPASRPVLVGTSV